MFYLSVYPRSGGYKSVRRGICQRSSPTRYHQEHNSSISFFKPNDYVTPKVFLRFEICSFQTYFAPFLITLTEISNFNSFWEPLEILGGGVYYPGLLQIVQSKKWKLFSLFRPFIMTQCLLYNGKLLYEVALQLFLN